MFASSSLVYCSIQLDICFHLAKLREVKYLLSSKKSPLLRKEEALYDRHICRCGGLFLIVKLFQGFVTKSYLYSGAAPRGKISLNLRHLIWRCSIMVIISDCLSEDEVSTTSIVAIRVRFFSLFFLDFFVIL